MSDAFRLDGRTALITGGTRGIGAAIAQEFADAGARVIITGRDEQRARSAATAIAANAVGFGYDAQVAGAYQQLADRVQTEIGQLDILVNNAAVLRPHVINKLTEAEFDELFGVNVKAALFLTKA